MKVLRNLQSKSKRIRKTSGSNASSQTENRIYNFGSFSFNQAEQQLLRNGDPVPLPPKAFEVLLVLNSEPRVPGHERKTDGRGLARCVRRRS